MNPIKPANIPPMPECKEPKQDQWIDTKEVLPYDSKRVLVAVCENAVSDIWRVEIAYHSDGEWHDDSGCIFETEPTVWKPLPHPPETRPIKLKPCPFCGGKAETRLLSVVCTKCQATISALRGEEEATSAWNKRTDPVVSEWIPFPYNRKRGLCTNCSEWSDSTPKYCPSCGAYMINGIEGDTNG